MRVGRAGKARPGCRPLPCPPRAVVSANLTGLTAVGPARYRSKIAADNH